LGQSDCGDEIGRRRLRDLRREFAEFNRAVARLVAADDAARGMCKAAKRGVAPWRGHLVVLQP